MEGGWGSILTQLRTGRVAGLWKACQMPIKALVLRGAGANEHLSITGHRATMVTYTEVGVGETF